MASKVFRYSRQKPWIPASTARPPAVRQPPARPPDAFGDASRIVTLTSGDVLRAAAAL